MTTKLAWNVQAKHYFNVPSNTISSLRPLNWCMYQHLMVLQHTNIRCSIWIFTLRSEHINLMGDLHSVEYHTRHRLESHNFEKNIKADTTSNLKICVLVITSNLILALRRLLYTCRHTVRYQYHSTVHIVPDSLIQFFKSSWLLLKNGFFMCTTWNQFDLITDNRSLLYLHRLLKQLKNCLMYSSADIF